MPALAVAFPGYQERFARSAAHARSAQRLLTELAEQDLQAGLEGIRRVLRPGAPLVVLEFSHPTAFPVKQGYEFYSKHILPRVGKAVSGSSEAYEYLPESVAAFPDGEDFLAVMRSAGYSAPAVKPLTFGISSLYRGRA